MEQEQINSLLAEIISMYSPSSSQKAVKKVISKLATSSIEEQIASDGIPYAAVKNAFASCGTILKEYPTENAAAGVILAGAANMNPAFVIIWIENNILHIIAQAKEGLIKQHTAEKAIQKLVAAVQGKRQLNEKNI